MSPRTTDLAIIGAGASGTHTLLALLKELLTTAPGGQQPVRILVIDRDPQFFSGVAYGNRSGSNSLTLSTLNDFLPDDERARFLAWLEPGNDALQRAGVDPAWAARHLADITAGRWGGLFVPRRLYGHYLGDRATAAIDDARSSGVAESALFMADVTSIDQVNGRFRLTTSDADDRSAQIDAAVVVLATGSPPTRRLHADDVPPDGFFHDIYEPGLDTTLTQLRRRLRGLSSNDREVLVIGGNAAALEFVSASSGIIGELRGRITVLAPSGRPRHWRRSKARETVELAAMHGLRKRATDGERVSAQQLYEAVTADLGAAVDAGTDAAAVRAIVESIPSFISFFDAEDRAALAGCYGIPISRLLRQDCGDAVEILESRIDAGVVSFRAGRYRDHQLEDGYFVVTATDELGRTSTLDTRYGAVVAATGFEGVSNTRAPLVQHMIRTGMVHPSTSDAGLRVDGRFQAMPRLYVVGPLLAGNAHQNMLIWHAESVRRIMSIAPEAASYVALELHELAAHVSPKACDQT